MRGIVAPLLKLALSLENDFGSLVVAIAKLTRQDLLLPQYDDFTIQGRLPQWKRAEVL